MKKHLIIALMAILPVACSGSDEPAVTLDPAAVAAGQKVFTDNSCSACHGETGTGDGAAAAALDPKPRNYSDAKWQSETSDESLKQVITDGGTAHGMSAAMIAYPNIKGDDLNNLVTFIRSLKK